MITKLFEILIRDELEACAETNNIIYNNQHGPRKKKSTCTNLSGYWHDLSDLADYPFQTPLFLLTFRKRLTG